MMRSFGKWWYDVYRDGRHWISIGNGETSFGFYNKSNAEQFMAEANAQEFGYHDAKFSAPGLNELVKKYQDKEKDLPSPT